MSIINIALAAISYFLLIVFVGTLEEKWLRITTIVITPPVVYLAIYLNGSTQYLINTMIGHAIGLILGLLVHWAIDKKSQET